MTTERLVVCRPEGGLNDMLCQIGHVCRYAANYNRLVIVDSNYSGAQAFREPFSRYFKSLTPWLYLDYPDWMGDVDSKGIFPQELHGRLNQYRIQWSPNLVAWTDAESGVVLRFDLDRDYYEQVLLYHSCGGGLSSMIALSHMRFHDHVVVEVLRRLRLIGSRYSAIHIRNTDNKSFYREFIEACEVSFEYPIFVATDNVECLEYCRSRFGTSQVCSFSTFPTQPGTPLHNQEAEIPLATKNLDAIADLILLGLASKFVKVPLAQSTVEYTAYSGFSLLADALRSSKILWQLLGADQGAFCAPF